ncbi:MAG TPA: VOC family protein [Nitrospiria bacterium]|nr:VOC family protein [Nitrospiria bacterium]
MRKDHVRALTLAAMAMLLTAGCATTRPQWPAVSDVPTEVHIQGRWVWAELFADNVEAEKTFYRDVFGWRFESRGTGTDLYTLVRADGSPIAGIIHYPKPAGAERSARWLPLMSVPDAARAADQAAASGGKVVVPPKNLPGRGETSVLEDPEGALFGVIHSGTGDPPDAFPSFNEWLWMELWAKDASRMADFYRPIGAYTVTPQEGPGDRTELHLVANGYPRAGIIELLRKDLPTTWLPYIRVKDLKMTVAGVERAGGRIVIEPSPEIRDGKVAVFLDPLGAAVGAAEWADENAGEGNP